MRVVRDRVDAHWLPSRHHFALFRLGAFIGLRASSPRTREGVMLMIERGQTAIEQYAVASWTTLTITCYFAAQFFSTWPLLAALAVSLPLAMIAMHIPMITVGALIVRGRNNIRLNSVVLMTLIIAASIHYADVDSWVRFVAWQFLAVVVLNAFCAVVVFLLRGPIARAEAAFAA